MSEQETSRALDKQAEGLPRKTPDYALLARLVLREGKPFNASAKSAGWKNERSS